MDFNKKRYVSEKRFHIAITASLFFAHGQSKTKPSKKSQHATGQWDSSFVASVGKSSVEMFIDKFADSLNKMPLTKLFPSFLEDADFDYNHAGLAPSHNPHPSRYMIISKVHDCRALRMILDSENEKYKKKPEKIERIEVEYSELSFYDLVKRRWEEMDCPLMY
ncbi:hypothetical protein ACQ86N_00610 [Puia sp. P3]|uniref:hypothetical protein n=1 Tax=Puia sp. P3 TaxID=3423952 RepID=UPI003D677B83